jgi:hypothetical protein
MNATCQCGKVIQIANQKRHCESKYHITHCGGQVGEGRILDVVKQGLNKAKTVLAKIGIQPRLDSYTNASAKVIREAGDTPIVGIAILRTPIVGVIDKLINIVSLGKWNEIKNKLHYDKVFHLAMLVTLKGGRQIIMEKNQTINIGGSYRVTPKTEKVIIPTRGEHTINSILSKAQQRMGTASFFTYSAFAQNCQDFIYNLLQASGLLNQTAAKFIKQDVSDLVKQSEHTAVLADALTYTAATADKLLGRGRKRQLK